MYTTLVIIVISYTAQNRDLLLHNYEVHICDTFSIMSQHL